MIDLPIIPYNSQPTQHNRSNITNNSKSIEHNDDNITSICSNAFGLIIEFVGYRITNIGPTSKFFGEFCKKNSTKIKDIFLSNICPEQSFNDFLKISQAKNSTTELMNILQALKNIDEEAFRLVNPAHINSIEYFCEDYKQHILLSIIMYSKKNIDQNVAKKIIEQLHNFKSEYIQSTVLISLMAYCNPAQSWNEEIFKLLLKYKRENTQRKGLIAFMEHCNPVQSRKEEIFKISLNYSKYSQRYIFVALMTYCNPEQKLEEAMFNISLNYKEEYNQCSFLIAFMEYCNPAQSLKEEIFKLLLKYNESSQGCGLAAFMEYCNPVQSLKEEIFNISLNYKEEHNQRHVFVVTVKHLSFDMSNQERIILRKISECLLKFKNQYDQHKVLMEIIKSSHPEKSFLHKFFICICNFTNERIQAEALVAFIKYSHPEKKCIDKITKLTLAFKDIENKNAVFEVLGQTFFKDTINSIGTDQINSRDVVMD